MRQKMPEAIDLTGQRFGRLLVVDFAGRDHKKRRLWNCKCDCGNEKTQTYGSLTVNKVKSCGCLIKEANTTHGKSNTKLYSVWHAMLQRCIYKGDQAFKDYGYRGISVCDRWLNFANFLEDMGHPLEGDSLDRIDVNGDYCKENCRWATAIQQANNRRNNKIIEYKGQRKTLSEWARNLGISKAAISYRLKSGWAVNRIFETPVDRSKNVSAARLLLFKK
jgi:hypothetical protein